VCEQGGCWVGVVLDEGVFNQGRFWDRVFFERGRVLNRGGFWVREQRRWLSMGGH